MPLQYKFFRIPVRDPSSWESELNRFLGSVRIANIQREFIDQGENSFWTLAVEYLTEDSGASAGQDSRKKPRVDYKNLLSPEDFTIFAKLREWRKVAATDEGAPVYTIFTNDQLAKIAEKRVRSPSELMAIDGVGDARAAKHGEAVFRIVSEAAPQTPEEGAE